MTVDTGFSVTLEDGPFAGAKRPLLAQAMLTEPPDVLHAYLCSCCGKVAVMPVSDPRNRLMGGAPTRYRHAGALTYTHEQ